MKLEKIEFKNFKSYSNVMTEISFNTNEPSLNLIVGSNGTGKSSIAECITYLLFGKIDNIKASDIPNRINKNFYGKLTLNCDGHKVIIERGLNPSLFKVTIDDNIIDTAGKLNVQGMLEENYFHIPYSVFSNTIILKVGEVKSLINLTPADKRNIIDKICGFSVYNQMAKVAKEKVKGIESDIFVNDGSLKTSNINLYHYNRQIDEIKENISTQEEIDEIVNKIKEVEKIKKDNENKINKLVETRNKLKNTNIQKISSFKELKNKIEICEEKITLIDSGKCPTCGSSLETDEFLKEKENLLLEKEEYQKSIDEIKKFVEDVQNKIKVIDGKESEIKTELSKNNLVDLKSELKYKESLNEDNANPIVELKSKLLVDIENLKSERDELDNKKKVYDFISNLLGENGIKKYIANQYVPIINNIIVEMMDYMNINYNVVFDTNFNVTITCNGYNVNYNTLSTGEKRRIDFATIISFIKFLKLQFGELNLLFLDEIFASVDINGVSDMIDILKNLSEDLNLNIYLIHHAKLEDVVFDNVFQTTKSDGFSKIEKLQQ